ncbi:MAG: sulfatase [Blastopirellula sp. JB062]
MKNMRPASPNILVLISHDLGTYVGPYGHFQTQTPHLTEFARQGIRLDRHFVSSPGCSQSRSSLMTGRYPHANGQLGLANWGWKLDESEILLPQALQDHGYRTTLFGIWHLHEWTLRGFDTVSTDVSTLDYSAEGVAKEASTRAANWLKNYPTDSQPFYLHVGFWEVHRPFCDHSEKEACDCEATIMQEPLPEYLPRTPESRKEMNRLGASVAQVDAGVGAILAALEESGHAENTIVLFTADHGLPFQRAKGTLYDPGVHVAAIARWPGRIAAASSTAQLSSNVDMMPTLLEAAGIDPMPQIQGSSLLSAWQGKRPSEHARQAVFTEKSFHEHYDPIRSVRTDRFKYIRNFADRPHLVLPSDVYNSPSRQSNTDDEAIWGPRPKEEFYDLQSDPFERSNLIDCPDRRIEIQEHQARLAAWMDSTADPLLEGPIRRPAPEQSGPVNGQRHPRRPRPKDASSLGFA